MLAAYRAGFAEIWTALVEAARSLPEVSDAALVELAGDMFRLHSTYADASVGGYREEYREIVRSNQREHSALVEAVLADSTSEGSFWEVAHALRLPLAGQFLVVAAEARREPLPVNETDRRHGVGEGAVPIESSVAGGAKGWLHRLSMTAWDPTAALRRPMGLGKPLP